MAHAKQKRTYAWPDEHVELAPSNGSVTPLPIRSVEQASVKSVSPWPERLAIIGAAIVFGSLSLAAFTGLASAWLAIIGVPGLLLTGLYYIAARGLDYGDGYMKL